MKLRYLADAISVAILAVALFWLAVPSSVFLKPLNLSYEKVNGEWIGHFHRLTPHGPVRISFTQRLEPSQNADGSPSGTCTHARPEPTPHDATERRVLTFRAPPNVIACLESPRPMLDRTVFSVWIGPLRLRPVSPEVIHQ